MTHVSLYKNIYLPCSVWGGRRWHLALVTHTINKQ